MGIKLNQFPLLTIFHVKGAVLGTSRNKKPATHFPSRNSFHYSSWNRDAICYVESVMIMVTSAMESKKCVCHPDCEGKKKLHRRWKSWITASQEHHSSSCVLPTWSFKAFFNVSPSSPDPALLSSGEGNSISPCSPICLPILLVIRKGFFGRHSCLTLYNLAYWL